MNKNKYNSGEIHVGEESRNRFISSSFINDTKKSSIAIIAAILVLATVACTFFAVFGDFVSLEIKPIYTTTTPSQSPSDKPADVDKDFPYATITDKTNFIAADGGKGMYQLDINSGYAILVRLSDMKTLGHKYADEIIFPASMTKVMTVVTALDLIGDLDDLYIFNPDILNQLTGSESTSDMKYLYNEYGSVTYTVRDLLYGISYRSGADSVVCLLDYLGLDMIEFAELMNLKANEIGLTNTHFGGAIGMDAELNTTTCRDVAAIMAYAMENPFCQDVFGGTSYRLDYIQMTYYNSTLSKTLTNMGTNITALLGENYTLLAAKSGFEDNAGYCLVSYIQNNETGEKFVLVTAKAERSAEYPNNRYTISDMETIFAWANP